MRLAAAFVVLSACMTNGHPLCETAEKVPIQSQLRDPSTGECISQGPTCNPSCGPCPAVADEAAIDWASCGGVCTGLDEAQCLVTPNCHASYQDDPTPSPVFWGCWDMPPSGAIEGACTGLDAQTCSEHDDCTSLYVGPVNQPQNFVESFESCQPKPALSCDTTTCASGDECLLTPAGEVQCVPTMTGGGCTGMVTCNLGPPTCPSDSTPAVNDGCYTGYCVPNTECTSG
jgi:hypothetical protein